MPPFFLPIFLLLWSVSSFQQTLHRHINQRTVSSPLHQSKPIITSKPAINYKSERLRSYFEDLELFVLVGASDDRSKIGNKVLRCMLTHQKSCIVLSKSLPEVEGAPTVPGLVALVEQLPSRYPSLSVDKVGMNMITPPAVTLNMIRQVIIPHCPIPITLPSMSSNIHLLSH